MNVADAAYAVVHDYPGGASSLAPRLGMSPAVLNSKVNPNTTTHHLTLAEAVAATVMTDDDRIFKSVAQEIGRMLMPLPCAADDAASDMAVLELVAAVWSGQGDLGSVIHRALGDGVVTQRELSELRTVAFAAQTRIAELVRRFEGMAEPEGRAP